MKPYSEACERNKDAILAILRDAFANVARVLEIGSGTGQHAVHFARHLPHLIWQTSDLTQHHAGIRAWLHEARLNNTLEPMVLDVDGEWPPQRFDGVFSANTVHIVSWPQTQNMFAGIEKILEAGGVFCLYGPFNYDGNYTSKSNAVFDSHLRATDPDSGVRDFEAVDKLAHANELQLQADHEMPANNRLLVWRKMV